MEGSKTCPVRPEDEAQQPGVQNMAWGLLTTAREVQPEWGPESPCKSVGSLNHLGLSTPGVHQFTPESPGAIHT